MEDNLVVNEQTTDVVTTETTEETSGKGKLIFYAILGLVICAPVTAVVFFVKWRNAKKKLEQYETGVPAAADPAPVEETKEETKEEKAPEEDKKKKK